MGFSKLEDVVIQVHILFEVFNDMLLQFRDATRFIITNFIAIIFVKPSERTNQRTVERFKRFKPKINLTAFRHQSIREMLLSRGLGGKTRSTNTALIGEGQSSDSGPHTMSRSFREDHVSS